MPIVKLYPNNSKLGNRILNTLNFDFTLLLTEDKISHTSVSLHRCVFLCHSVKLRIMCRGANYYQIAIVVPNVKHAIDLLISLYTEEIDIQSDHQYENILKTAEFLEMNDIVTALKNINLPSPRISDDEYEEFDTRNNNNVVRTRPYTRRIPVYNVEYEEKDIYQSNILENENKYICDMDIETQVAATNTQQTTKQQQDKKGVRDPPFASLNKVVHRYNLRTSHFTRSKKIDYFKERIIF